MYPLDALKNNDCFTMVSRVFHVEQFYIKTEYRIQTKQQTK